MAIIALTVSCGGSSDDGGGSGGTLTAAEVEQLFLLSSIGTPIEDVLQVLLNTLAQNCGDGAAVNVAVDSGDVNCAEGGTWRLVGTINCSRQINGDDMTITVNSSTDSTLALSSCGSEILLASVTAEKQTGTSFALTGTIDPFAMDNTTIDITNYNDPTSVILNGIATMTYSNMLIGSGDAEATISYTQQITFTDFNVEAEQPLGMACAQNTVSATQGDDSGTCTLQSSCMSCQ